MEVEVMDAFQTPLKSNCEYCHRYFNAYNPGEKHHVYSRGSGGRNIKENRIDLCRWNCHIQAHSGLIKKAELLRIIATREGKMLEEVIDINNRARYGW